MTKRINYRKIYEQHYGKIPVDVFGRSYQVHHIDGNHDNNDPSNLKAITIDEHYNIHYKQEDYGACYLLIKQIKLSSTEISELATKVNKQRVDNGTHNFLGGKIQKEANAKRVENGTHQFLTRENGTNVNTDRLSTGEHHFLDSHRQKELGQRAFIKGTHQSQNKKMCGHCNKVISLSNHTRWHGNNCKFRILKEIA
jgi:hypothetical protein